MKLIYKNHKKYNNKIIRDKMMNSVQDNKTKDSLKMQTLHSYLNLMILNI